MTGADHYAEAERLVDREDLDAWSAEEQALRLARAQVHATLALAAATAHADGGQSRTWGGYGKPQVTPL